MKVAKEKDRDAIKLSTEKTRILLSRKDLASEASAIKESPTAGNSYPTAIVLRASVGLKDKNKATGIENFANLVLRSSSTKNAHPTA